MLKKQDKAPKFRREEQEALAVLPLFHHHSLISLVRTASKNFREKKNNILAALHCQLIFAHLINRNDIYRIAAGELMEVCQLLGTSEAKWRRGGKAAKTHRHSRACTRTHMLNFLKSGRTELKRSFWCHVTRCFYLFKKKKTRLMFFVKNPIKASSFIKASWCWL